MTDSRWQHVQTGSKTWKHVQQVKPEKPDQVRCQPETQMSVVS
jgi:hypothetical protein